MRRTIPLLTLLAFASLLAASCTGDHATARKEEDPKLIYNRGWIDRLPEKHTDYFHAMIVLDYLPIGFFQKASSYDLRLERFDFNRDKNKLTYVFPQTGKKGDFSYKIYACDDLPPFDLCLELNRNPWGGPKKYHGMREDDQNAAFVKSFEHRANDEARAFE